MENKKILEIKWNHFLARRPQYKNGKFFDIISFKEDNNQRKKGENRFKTEFIFVKH